MSHFPIVVVLFDVSGCKQLGKCDVRHNALYKCWRLIHTYNCKFRLDDASRFVKIRIYSKCGNY